MDFSPPARFLLAGGVMDKKARAGLKGDMIYAPQKEDWCRLK